MLAVLGLNALFIWPRFTTKEQQDIFTAHIVIKFHYIVFIQLQRLEKQSGAGDVGTREKSDAVTDFKSLNTHIFAAITRQHVDRQGSGIIKSSFQNCSSETDRMLQ